MDVLSEVLKAVKLDGAMFYNAEYSAPLVFSRARFRHTAQLRALLPGSAQHNRQTGHQVDIIDGQESEAVEKFGGPCRGRTYGPLIKSSDQTQTELTQDELSQGKIEASGEV